jgi:hypothetical protein
MIVLDDGTNGSLTFAFTTNKTLTRVEGSKTNTLLTEVDFGQFAIYQHALVSNSYDQVVAPDASTAKQVGVKWTCSRQIFGAKLTTDNGQTARIVIRKN